MDVLLITDKQRQAIDQYGTPLPLADEATNTRYMLLSMEFISDPDLGGFTARIPGISAFGEGDTEQDASLALREALRGYLEAFKES